jgi:hypothetical protein
MVLRLCARNVPTDLTFTAVERLEGFPHVPLSDDRRDHHVEVDAAAV